VGGNFDCSDNQLTSLEGAPQEVGRDFYCSGNQITSLKGAPRSVRKDFHTERNPVSERTIKGIYKKMQSGMSWPDALSSYWERMRNGEDKILLAPHHPDPSREDVKGYRALDKYRKKII
jgi:hypothetical protein